MQSSEPTDPLLGIPADEETGAKNVELGVPV
jgi:hypothetical protein